MAHRAAPCGTDHPGRHSPDRGDADLGCDDCGLHRRGWPWRDHLPGNHAGHRREGRRWRGRGRAPRRCGGRDLAAPGTAAAAQPVRSATTPRYLGTWIEGHQAILTRTVGEHVVLSVVALAAI